MIRIRYLLLAIVVVGMAYWVESKLDSSRKSRQARDEQSRIWDETFDEFLKSRNISSRQIQKKEFSDQYLTEQRIRIPAQESFTRLNLAITELAIQKKVTVFRVREDLKKKNLTMEFGPEGFVFLRAVFWKDERVPWHPVRLSFLVTNTEETGIIEKFSQLDTKITFALLPGNRKLKEIKEVINDFDQEYIYQCPVEYNSPDRNDLFSISPGMNEKEIRRRLSRAIKNLEGIKGIFVLNRLNPHSMQILEKVGKEKNLPILDWELVTPLQGKKPDDFEAHLKDILNDSDKIYLIVVPPVKPAVEGLESVLLGLYRQGVEILFLSTLMETLETPTLN